METTETIVPRLQESRVFVNSKYLVQYVLANDAKYSVIYVFTHQGHELYFSIDPHLRSPRSLVGDRLTFDPDCPPDPIPQQEFDLETRQWVPSEVSPIPEYPSMNAVCLVRREGKYSLEQAVPRSEEDGLLVKAYTGYTLLDRCEDQGALVYVFHRAGYYRDTLVLGKAIVRV